MGGGTGTCVGGLGNWDNENNEVAEAGVPVDGELLPLEEAGEKIPFVRTFGLGGEFVFFAAAAVDVVGVVGDLRISGSGEGVRRRERGGVSSRLGGRGRL